MLELLNYGDFWKWADGALQYEFDINLSGHGVEENGLKLIYLEVKLTKISGVMNYLDCQLDRMWNHHRNKSLGVSVRNYLDKVNWGEKSHPQCRQYYSIPGVLDWIKWRKGAEHLYSPFSVLWPQSNYDQLLLQVPVTMPSHHDKLYSQILNQNSFFLEMFSQAFVTIPRKIKNALLYLFTNSL